MTMRSTTLPVPPAGGTHCAGVGCQHDELAASGLEPIALSARPTARHRRASTGRRVRIQVADIPESPRTGAHSA